MQNEHILLHPLIIDIKAKTLFGLRRTGAISAYVYSALNATFICPR